MMVIVLSVFQRDVLDGILDLIESVPEGFPTDPYYHYRKLEINFTKKIRSLKYEYLHNFNHGTLHRVQIKLNYAALWKLKELSFT